MDNNDTRLAVKLQQDDPEQFDTLVRMHLSFVLDLHTDESDTAVEKVKSRTSKWRFVPGTFTKKVKSTLKGVTEGAPLTQEGICQVYQLIEHLSKEKNICQEGIFRRTGSLARQSELKALLNSGVTLDLSKSQFSVHDCASVLKSFLSELPEPLLTEAHYLAYCQLADMCGNLASEAKLLRALQLLILLLPTENRVLLRDLIQLLHLTASFEDKNKMSSHNLSTLFTPHLLCNPRKLTPEEFHINSQTLSGVVAFMISQNEKLFNIPPELATDIRVYWSEKDRKSKLTPKKELDESITSSNGTVTAATIYTFVDRESTAKAHAVSTTEAALAELYAHVQSLPESSNKRKLIKKYNKENGQGTPLQMQKQPLGSKGIGDSIKKHIFNKSVKRNKHPLEGHYVNHLQEKVNSPEASKLGQFQPSIADEPPNVTNWNCMGRISDVKSPAQNCLTSPVHENMVCANQDATEDAVLTGLLSLTPSVRSESPALEEEFESPPKSPRFVTPSDHSLHTPVESTTTARHSDAGTCQSNPSASLSLPQPSPTALLSLPQPSPTALPGFCTPKLPPPGTGITNTIKLGLTPRNAWSTFLMTSTPAPLVRATDTSSLFTPIADDNNSMSPITRSTQRMPKSMQETMMTPRSRKPVIALSGTNLCQLANFSAWEGKEENSHSGEYLDAVDSRGNKSRVHDVSKLEPKLSTIGENSPQDKDSNKNDSDTKSLEFSSSDSLTSTFRSYLCSRSVLTASPVDLSFSSQAGDFDTGTSSWSDDKVTTGESMSDSLLYCLDGNLPSSDTSGVGAEDSDHSKYSSGFDQKGVGVSSRKRSANSSQICHKILRADDYESRTVEKISQIEKFLSASAINPELNRFGECVVHETSL